MCLVDEFWTCFEIFWPIWNIFDGSHDKSAKKLIVDIIQFRLKEMECEYCGKMFVDDDDTVANYLMHESVHHKYKITAEEKIFEDFRKKMIKQKDEYERSKEKDGDSDLVFNAKERDAHNPR